VQNSFSSHASPQLPREDFKIEDREWKIDDGERLSSIFNPQSLFCDEPFTNLLAFSCVPHGVGSPFPVIESKLIGVASNFDSIAVRVKKADGAVAGDFQNLRSANDGDLSPFKHRVELVDFLVRADINAKVMQLGYAFTAYVLCPPRQLHQSNVMVLLSEAHKGHLGAPVPGRNLHSDDRAIEVLRSL
jgi:hypothetical protein